MTSSMSGYRPRTPSCSWTSRQHRCAWRAVRRSRERADFWWWLLAYRRRSRPLLLQAIAAHAGDAEIYVLQTPRAVRRFVARIASGTPEPALTARAGTGGALNRVRRQGIRSTRGRCERSWCGVVRINMRATPSIPRRAAAPERSSESTGMLTT